VSSWSLTLREKVSGRVDAAPICLLDWEGQSIRNVERTPLTLGRDEICLADLFNVKHHASESSRLVIEGDLRKFDAIGYRHRGGLLHIVGSVGDHLGGAMSGGLLRVDGDAGDHVAAPRGAARQGMRGGRVLLGGSAGNYVGHRMRRGEVVIEGDAGRFTANQMFAGTILVGGVLDAEAAIGIRRGSLLLSTPPQLPGPRFSEPVMFRSVFPRLIHFAPGEMPVAAELLDRLAAGGFFCQRGDRAMGGKGEVLWPVPSFTNSNEHR